MQTSYVLLAKYRIHIMSFAQSSRLNVNFRNRLTFNDEGF
jgi:hypothetical protein